ncbi:hypothetical protein C6503_14255 [Candidatus Poribacteria bacterium]|nr:MAG: hypothetical protein C6503_14255 [Candidatus Poribacteria bacterium]
MDTYKNERNVPYAPTDTADLYPETDGKPMAASDFHLEILIWLLQMLKAHFAQMPDVYVSGDILTYYTEGDPRAVVAPDVLVSFGIGQKQRHTYKVWEEGKVPDFVMEFSSKTTYHNDLTDKMDLYATLGIPNYLLYDAEALYLPSPLMGFQLVKGVYVPIPPSVDGGVHSDVLGLDFYIWDRRLGVYDPVSEQWLQTPAEQQAARAEDAEARAEDAEARAEQETIARQKAEEEVERLREQLARSHI